MVSIVQPRCDSRAPPWTYREGYRVHGSLAFARPTLSRSILPEHNVAKPCRGLGLHPGQDVLVDLHREGDAGVAETFTDHLDRLTFLEHERGMGVPQIVQSDSWQIHPLQETLEGL